MFETVSIYMKAYMYLKLDIYLGHLKISNFRNIEISITLDYSPTVQSIIFLLLVNLLLFLSLLFLLHLFSLGIFYNHCKIWPYIKFIKIMKKVKIKLR